MTFEEVWDTVEIGMVITVSDGRSEPGGGLGSFRYNAWRSHNFSGSLVEKLEAGGSQPRRLRIADAASPAVNVLYDVAENVSHTFSLVP